MSSGRAGPSTPGIWKPPVDGPRMVRRLNIDGDGQGDLAGHGGEHRAVLVYQLDSYRHWQQQLGRDDLDLRQLRRELHRRRACPTTRSASATGTGSATAEFEVTQPRVTCYRVGMRLGEPRHAACSSPTTGPASTCASSPRAHVQAGDEIVKTRDRAADQISVAEIDALLYLPPTATALDPRRCDIPALSPGWQASFRELAADAACADAGGGRQPAWPGFRPLRRRRRRPRERDRLLDPASPRPTARRCRRALPGQFLTLQSRGRRRRRAVRSYSLSSAPGRATTASASNGSRTAQVSRYLHAHVRAGDTLDVAAPRGDFTLRCRHARSCSVRRRRRHAGARHAARARRRRAVRARCGGCTARSDRTDTPFAAEVSELLGALPHAHRARLLQRRPRRRDRRTGASAGRPRRRRCVRLDCPPTPTRTCAVPTRSWTP